MFALKYSTTRLVHGKRTQSETVTNLKKPLSKTLESPAAQSDIITKTRTISASIVKTSRITSSVSTPRTLANKSGEQKPLSRLPLSKSKSQNSNVFRTSSFAKQPINGPIKNPPNRNVGICNPNKGSNIKQSAIPLKISEVNTLEKSSLPAPITSNDMEIQTNEAEILDHSLLIGDIKYMQPSRELAEEIDKMRKDRKTKELLKTTRKFEKHNERQEEHLSDLSEFLDKSFVTKKRFRRSARNAAAAEEEERKFLAAMDECLNQQIPKTDSITDIKTRIEQKEKQLLSMFDNLTSISIA